MDSNWNVENIKTLHADLQKRATTRRLSIRDRKSHDQDLTRRAESLLRMKQVLLESEAEVLSALRSDLARDDFESFVNEFGFVLKEIDHALLEFRSWAKDRVVETPMMLWPASSKILSQAKGAVLIMAPWNYPFQLSLAPLVPALAAGNLAVIKPSEFAPATAALLERLVTKIWPSGEVVVVNGEAEVSEELLRHRWDHVFFTGSPAIGKKVMAACAQFLTPVTLELGGKSPCVLGPFGKQDSAFEVAVRRILWGKSVNAGQTCVAPDFLLVHKSEKARFLACAKKVLREFHGEAPLDSSSFCRIISKRHFDRLLTLLGELAPGEILHGGGYDRESLKLEVTLVETSFDKRLHAEEIFGPILPIVVWETEEELQEALARHPRPLAFYVFAQDRAWANEVMRQNLYGGGCVGDTLVQLANPELPFGGCGESGIGAYHGKFGFDVFSHQQAVMERRYSADLKLRYPPYSGVWKRLKGLLS